MRRRLKPYRYAALFFAAALIGAAFYFTRDIPVLIYKDPQKVVVLDAGHGGFDGGAQSRSGITEKTLNLQVAKKLELLLLQRGYTVVMTREGDYALQDDGESGKPADLKARVKIAKEHPEGIFVSIHMNKFAVAKYCGSQVFFSKSSEAAGVLAGKIQESIREGLQPDNTRLSKPADRDIYLLENLEMPAVIVECGFLSNPAEALMLTSDTYQASLAECIADGIDLFYCPDDIDSLYEMEM